MGLKRHSGGRGREGRQGREGGRRGEAQEERAAQEEGGQGSRRGERQEGRAAGGEQQEGGRQGEGGRREGRTGGDATASNLKRVPHHWGVVGTKWPVGGSKYWWSRWIDLTLNSHLEAVISEIYQTIVFYTA